MKNTGGNTESANRVTCQHYLFYLILHMMAVKKQIPYSGVIPPLQFPAWKGTWCGVHADIEMMQMLSGILNGCGMEVYVCEILRYPVYENGHSHYRNLDLEMEQALYTLMQRVPKIATVCWFDEVKDIVKECLRYGYHGHAGAAVLFWRSARYGRQSGKGRKEQRRRLDRTYEISRRLFHDAILLPEEPEGEALFAGMVMPLHRKEDSGEVRCLRLLDFLDPMALYSLIDLGMGSDRKDV